MLKDSKGFTLIEILVVIGIIAILAAVVLIAINPARQFAQARNSERTSETNTILNAIGQRMADNKGVFNGTFTVGTTTYTCSTLPSTATAITASNGGSATAGDLGCLVPTYVNAMPTEPSSGNSYTVSADSTGRITVAAPGAELGQTISVTR